MCHDGNCRYIYICVCVLFTPCVFLYFIFLKTNKIKTQKTNHKHTSYQVLIPTCFDTKVPSSGSLSTTRFPRTNNNSGVMLMLQQCGHTFGDVQSGVLTFPNFYEKPLIYVLDYETLLLINSLMMAPWWRNMLELTPDMKCVLWSVLVFFNSAFCWFFLKHGTGGIVPRILNLGIKWRWLDSFTRRPFYPPWNSFRHPLAETIDGFQSHSGRCRAVPGVKPRFIGHPTRSLVNMMPHAHVNTANSPVCIPMRSFSWSDGLCRIVKPRTADSRARDMRAISRAWDVPLRTGRPDTTM